MQPEATLRLHDPLRLFQTAHQAKTRAWVRAGDDVGQRGDHGRVAPHGGTRRSSNRSRAGSGGTSRGRFKFEHERYGLGRRSAAPGDLLLGLIARAVLGI